MPDATWQALRDALPKGGLFAEKSWRWAPRPLALSKNQAEELSRLGQRLWLFQKACNDLYALSASGRQPSWVAELLDRGKPAALVALSREKAFRQEVPRILRPDLLLTETGFVMTELDSIPGGIGLTDWLNTTYATLGFHVLGGTEGMRQGFASIAPDGDILVSKEAATYRPEMEWIAPHSGHRVCDAEHYAHQGDKCKNVYRFFELFDLENIPGAEALQRATLEHKIHVTPPWKPQLEEKLWLALFWMRPLREFWRRALSERHFLALQKIIPRSWILDPTKLPPHAEIPELGVQDFHEIADFSQKQRELVIKASGFSELAWGARSVVIGSDEPQSVWKDAVHFALKAFPYQPHVLQRFHKSRTIEHSAFADDSSGRIEPFPAKVRLCPYYFCADDRPVLGGALATLCPPDKKILHGMRDAVLVPASVEE